MHLYAVLTERGNQGFILQNALNIYSNSPIVLSRVVQSWVKVTLGLRNLTSDMRA